MAVRSISMRVHMQGDCQVENITPQVQEAVRQTQLRAGILTLFIKHTTASVLIIEDEPGIRADTKALWGRMVPPIPRGGTIPLTRVKTTAIATCVASFRGSRSRFRSTMV